MKKTEYLAVHKYLFLKKEANYGIKTELMEVYGDSASSLSTMKYWTAEFKHRHTSIFDVKIVQVIQMRFSEITETLHDI